MTRWITGIAIALFILMIIIFITLTTPSGLKISLRLANEILPGEIHYAKISGTTVGPIDVTDFTYQYNHVQIAAEKLHISWSPAYLLIGKLHIKNISAEHVKITITNGEKIPKNLSLPELAPPNLSIESGKLKDLTLEQPNVFLWHFKLLRVQRLVIDHELSADVFTEITKPYPVNIEFMLAGTMQHYNYRLLAKSRDIHWRIHGKGTSEWIQFETHQSHTLGGHLNASAKIYFSPYLRWDGDVDIRRLDLHRLYRHWPKQLNLRLKSKGHYKAGIPYFNLDLNLSTPGSSIIITGHHDQKWNLAWKASIGDLSTLLGESSGHLTGQGTIIGPTHQPLIRGELSGGNIITPKYRAAQLNARWNVDLAFHQPSEIDINATNFEAYYLRLSQVQLTAKGNPQSHQITNTLLINNRNLGQAVIRLDFKGHFAQSIWQGVMSRFTVQSNRFGTWQLRQHPTLTLSTAQVTVPPVCLYSGKGQLCLQGHWDSKKPWQLTLTGENVALGPFLAIFKHELALHAMSKVNISVAGTGNRMTETRFALHLSKGYVVLPGLLGSSRSTFESGSIIGSIDPSGLTANTTLNLSGKNKMTASVRLPGYSLFSKLSPIEAIFGQFTIDTDDLKLIRTFIPAVVEPHGRLIATIDLSGKLDHPIVTGKIEMRHGSLSIPQLKITLTNVLIDTNAEGKFVTYNVRADSQNRPIQIIGKTELTPPLYPTEFSIRGDNVLIMDTTEYTIYASPDLTVNILGRKVTVKGVITIPRALLQPMEFNDAVTLPEDVIFVGPGAAEISPWELYLDITIIAGDNVILNTQGVEGRLDGKINIVRTPEQSTIATGKIGVVKGTYTAHKRVLIIEPDSYISYVKSPLLNPNLNIRAQRELKTLTTSGIQVAGLTTVTVGVDVRGTLRHPNVSLYSFPPLSQADILSYLIFGHPANANTPDNVNFLIQAIDDLDIGGGRYTPGGVVDQITQGLGLSEFGVETQTALDTIGTPLGQEESAFVVGRYISPRVYVRYSRGLVLPINIVQIRYLIGNNWAIQTEASSLGNGVDVLYTVQRP